MQVKFYPNYIEFQQVIKIFDFGTWTLVMRCEMNQIVFRNRCGRRLIERIQSWFGVIKATK